MKPCDQLWKAEALEDGSLGASDVASFERHGRVCKECRDRMRLDLRLRGLMEELAGAEPAELPLRRLRARILSDARAATHLRSRWTRAWLLGAVALVAALLTITAGVIRRRLSLPRDEAFAGAVTAGPGAEWARSRDAKVETVTLTQGELWIVVRKQAPDERFLVETPDGELEVRGTTFEVLVDRQATRQVHVVEGRVALHLEGRPVLELAAGQAWAREVTEETSTPGPVRETPTPPPPAVTATLPIAQAPPRADSRRPNTEGADYAGAVELYRGAHYAEAAEGFRRFTAQHRDSGLTEDATFLEALSLTKAGHVDAGSVAAWRHLEEFPNSFHKKEASVLVARAARDRGDCKEARRSLAPWLGPGADVTVREALGVCSEP